MRLQTVKAEQFRILFCILLHFQFQVILMFIIKLKGMKILRKQSYHMTKWRVSLIILWATTYIEKSFDDSETVLFQKKNVQQESFVS